MRKDLGNSVTFALEAEETWRLGKTGKQGAQQCHDGTATMEDPGKVHGPAIHGRKQAGNSGCEIARRAASRETQVARN